MDRANENAAPVARGGAEKTNPNDGGKVTPKGSQKYTADADANKPTKVIEAVTQYIDRGWAVVPLKPGTKRPHNKNWQTENFGAESFEASSNVGVKLGPVSGGLVDIDLEWPESRDLWTETTCTFGRPSAAGSHHLYRCHEITKTKKFLLPPDCKGDGRLTSGDHELCVLEVRGSGQTMFPPSVHPSNEPLAWANEGDPPTKTAADIYEQAGMTAFLAVVARCYPGQGSRDDACMALTGVLLRKGIEERQVDAAVVHLAEYCRDDEAQFRGKAQRTANQLGNKVAVTGLPRLVELLGLPPSCAARFSDWLGLGDDEQEPLATLEEMSVADMLAAEPPERRWLLRNLLPLGVVGLLAAGGGTGKSVLTLQIAVAVATGRPFLGIAVDESGGVLLLAAEDEREELHRRLYAVVQALREDGEFAPSDEARLRQNLLILPRTAKDNRLTYQADGAVLPTGRAASIAATMNQMNDPRLVVLDPVSRFRGGDENSNEHATRFVEEAERIREATGATVVMPHHVSKAGLSAGAEGLSADGVRGASALLDGARWAAAMGTLRKDEASKFGVERGHAGSYVRLETVKNNYAAPWEGLWLRRLAGGVLVRSQLKQESREDRRLERDAAVLGRVQDLLREKQRLGKPLTESALRRYSGADGRLGAGDQYVRRVVAEAVDAGEISKTSGGRYEVLLAPEADF